MDIPTRRVYTAFMRIGLIVLLLVWGCQAWAAPWVGQRLGGVTVFVHPGQERLAAEIGARAAVEVPRVAGALGVAHPTPIPIYVYASDTEFLRDNGLDIELLGISLPPTGTIRIVVTDNRELFERTLAHECTHSLIGQRLGMFAGLLPLWVNEGLAGYLSDPVSAAEMPQVAHLVHRDGVLTLDELAVGFDRAGTREAAYLQSRSMIGWLDYHYPGAIPRILAVLATGQPFPTALRKVTGLTPADWLQQWQAGIPAILYWLTLLGSPIWYAPLALIVMIVAIIRILRKRAAANAEDDEDEEPEEAPEPAPDHAPDA